VSDPNFTYSPDLLSLTGSSKNATLSSTTFTLAENALPNNNAVITYRGLQVNGDDGNSMAVQSRGLVFPSEVGTSAFINDATGSPGTAFQVLTAGPAGGSVQWGNSAPCGLAVIPTAKVGFTNYYIPTPIGAIFDGTAVVSAVLQIPDGATQNWIVDSSPFFGGDGFWYIKVAFSTNVTYGATAISWSVHADRSTPVDISNVAP
jgi:hypothetical protein